MKYTVTISGSAVIEAHNIVVAAGLARRIRVIPSMLHGRFRRPNNRDSLPYSIHATIEVSQPSRKVKP